MEDADATDEYWLTDDVIAESYGYIPLACVGVLAEVNESRCRIQDWLKAQRELGIDLKQIKELDCLWVVGDGVKPPEWQTRLRCDSFEEELPLPQPPSTWP